MLNAESNHTLSLPNLLINRLVLNLRLFDQAPNAPSSGHLPDLDFVQNRILGNIGAPLDHSQWDSLMDEEVEGEQDAEEEDIGDRAGNELETMVPVVCNFLTSREVHYVNSKSFRFMVEKMKKSRWCQSHGMCNHNCKFMFILIWFEYPNTIIGFRWN